MGNINKVPKYCKGCTCLWTKGIKTGGHSAWCCKFQGGPASKKLGHCKNVGGRVFKKKKF